MTPPVFDANVPSPARVYNAIGGGRDNFRADREAAAAILELNPDARANIAANREFLARAADWAAWGGVRQYLDLGCGFPPPAVTAGDGGRVLYADSDPVVASHAAALLSGPGAGVLKADLRDIPAVTAAAAHAGFSFAEPVCVILGAVLHCMDAADARTAVTAYTRLLAPGSIVVVSVWATCDDTLAEKITGVFPGNLYRHTRDDIAGWFTGLEVTAPGICGAKSWRPGWATGGSCTRPVGFLAAVARKP